MGAPSDVTRARTRRPGHRRVVFLVIALTLLGLGAVVSSLQPPRSNPLQPPGLVEWFLSPHERNSFARLPLFRGRVRRLFVLRDGKDAWIAAGGGDLFHSADRGVTWRDVRISTAPGTNIVDVKFTSAERGWALDAGGSLFETANGGKTWSQRALPPGRYYALDVSGGTIAVTGADRVVARSAAQPQWRVVTPTSEAGLAPAAVGPDGRIWVAVRQRERAALLVDDGGARRTIALSGVREGSRAYDIVFTSPTTMRVLADDAVVETSDAGRTWQRVAVVPEDSDQCAFSRAAGAMFGLTDDRLIVPVEGPWSRGTHVEAIEVFSDGTAVAIAHEGQITVSRGEASRPATLPYAAVQSIHAADDGVHLWSAGAAGTILSSRDGGRSWNPQRSGVASTLRSIAFAADRRTGWAVGEYGAVVRTSDGGKTWTSAGVPQLSSALIEHVTVSADGTRVVMKGNADVVASTNDGGARWRATVEERFPGVSIDDYWVLTRPAEGRTSVTHHRRGGSTSSTVSVEIDAIVADGSGLNAWATAGFGLPVARTRDGGTTWELIRPAQLGGGDPAQTTAVRFIDEHHGFAEDILPGRTFETRDGGVTWRPMPGARVASEPLTAHRDGQRVWTASADLGTPVRSVDGGRTWLRPVYGRSPAPWFWACCVASAFFMVAAWRPERAADPARSIEDVPWNDRPVETPEEDRLEFQPLANGIARFLGNPKTEPPLTIAVTGAWGSGKSSLMNMVMQGVRRYGHIPVWFNAWHYQSEEHLLPAVMESIRRAVPPFWSWNGIRLRVRLLGVRGMRNWLPALAIIATLVTTTAFFARDPKLFRELLAGLQNLGTPASDDLLRSAGLLVSSIVSLVVVLRALNAFGVSGSRLGAILSGTVRLSDVGGDTGFRHTFARAFRELTDALGPQRRLVLFVDDLDRCRPDHVLAVLETMNFLVTSGDCFIIAGMDRQRVERCVAMKFEEESKAIGSDLDGDGVPETVTAVQYARHYLEKLVNIEAPVPRGDSAQSRGLVELPDDEEAVRATPFGEWVIGKLETVLPLLAVLGVLVLAARFGYYQLHERTRAAVPRQLAFVDTPGVEVIGVSNRAAPAVQAPAQRQQQAMLIDPRVPATKSSWPAVLLAVFAVAGTMRLSVEQSRPERDSKVFRRALVEWHPLLHHAGATPRSIKRCVNRVRYYAMRQRRNPLPPTLVERLTSLLTRRKKDGERDTQLAIPEEVLVPLSFIQHVSPAWLREDGFWQSPRGFLASKGVSAAGIETLEAKGLLTVYREQFEAISAGIDVRG
ncbi:MAG TPA: YCF48-related protein [Thermoanaerobaculia bacterium]|jgi:photosystem II stability/assembly factor-like uncharacterized protein